jgi:iron complex outermembrane receptor protein
MAYFTFGTSWRPGVSVVGDFNPTRTTLENSFLILKPEKSKSYELGLKATALDNRLRANLSLYQQDYTNFVYRAGGNGAYFIDQTRGPGVVGFNFVAGVPVRVRGVELDTAYQLTSDWDLGVLGAYSEGKIKNGLVPCNDYSPRDGIPDAISAPAPSIGTISATGDVVSGCGVNYRASSAPLWSGTVHTEYRLPITGSLSAFARALLTLNGDSQNDPANPLDDYKSYELLNLYFGVRDPKGVWEASVFGKNVTNTQRVLQLSSAPAIAGTASLVSNYYGGAVDGGIAMTPRREFGVNLRYNFGAK